MAVVTQAIQDQVTELYIGFFGRAPDAAGFGYWTNRLAQGDVTIQQISKAFSATPEFVSNYNGLTPTQQVTKVYQNVLNRAPDAGGLAYWVGQITTGTQSIADVVWNVTNSAFIQSGTADGLLVQNKVTVGEYFAITLASNDTASAATAYNLVTSNPASIAQAEATLVSATYTLTTGIDAPGSGAFAVSSPTGNAAINGTMVYAAGGTTVDATSTLNVNDIIRATGSNNSLNLTVTGGNATTAFVPASISGVQTFNVRNVSGNTNTLDASTMAGLTNYNSNLSTSVVTVTNLASGASATVTGNGQLTNANSNFGWAAAVTAGTLNLTGGTSGGAVALSGTALASQVINSNGVTANTIGALELGAATTSLTINATSNLTTGAVTNNTAAALTTLNVTGAGAVNLSATGLQNTVATINAATNTGGITATLGTGVTSFVGGTGSDVITSAATTAAGAVINAGTGSADTLVLAATNDVSTAAKGASYTNFENLVLNNSQNVSYISGITAVQLNAMTAKSVTGLNAAQAQALTVAGTQTTSLTLGLVDSTGTADVVSLSMLAGSDVAALSVAGVETLNVTSTTGSTGSSSDVSLAAGGAAALTTVNLNGAYGVGFVGTNSANALTVNGASLTGIATVSGNFVNASVITTGSANDSITLGTGFATYNSGLGNDTFNGSLGEINTGASYNTLNGGGGTDTLNIAGAAAITMVDTNFKQMSGIEAIVQATTGANALSVTTGAWFNQNFAGAVSYTATTGAEASTLDLATYTGNATIGLTSGATTGHSVTVTTGSGADSVTVAASAFVGAAGKLITVTTGTGADTISVSPAAGTALAIANAITITGGSGADVITLGTHVNGSSAGTAGFAQIVVGATDTTTAAFDSVTGFNLGGAATQSDNLDFTGSATVAANATSQAVTGYTAAQLTYSIATGILTFSGTSAATLTAAQAIAAVESLALANTATVLFVNNGNSYVFNNNTSGDALVQLVGVTAADALVTTNTNGANDLFIS